jgi:hypothetical protein
MRMSSAGGHMMSTDGGKAVDIDSGMESGDHITQHAHAHTHAHKHTYTYYADGTPKTLTHWHDGHQEGLHREWHANGEQARECTYSGGKLTGVDRAWRETGDPLWEVMYAHGHRNGSCKVWDDTGTYEYVFLDDRGRHTPIQLPHPWYRYFFRKHPIDVIVQIRVPKEARRVTPVDIDGGHESRVEYGLVEAICNRQGSHFYTRAQSFGHAGSPPMVYEVGKWVVTADGFDDRIDHACGAGLHVHRYSNQCDIWFDR